MSTEPSSDPPHSMRAYAEGQDVVGQPQSDGHGRYQHGENNGAPEHIQPGGFQDSEWQGDEPISRRYLAADILHDDEDDMDEDAIPGTP